MKSFILLLLASIPSLLYSQKKVSTQKEIISKWSKAIINLEMRKEAFENLDSTRSFKTLEQALKITNQLTGSAIYFSYNNKRFLITARHVLFDKISVEQKHKHNIVDTINDQYNVFMKILRIPTEKEASDTTIPEFPISIISALPYEKCAYVFSSPEEDLAIIMLDSRYPPLSIFADLLERRGYKPIKISDIDTSSLEYGQDVISVGYPSISFEGIKTLDKNKFPWQSNLIFDAVVTFGKVALPSYRKTYFISDLTCAPGNSGGAIISNNKLVGIVSQQPTLSLEDENGNSYSKTAYRLPYTIGIKASLLMPLLRQLISKVEKNGNISK